jgi:hypothetical protein
MGRTLSSNRQGEEWRDLTVVVDPPCSEFNPQTDLNDTATQRVQMLSPAFEGADGPMDASPPFNVPDPLPLVLGQTKAELTCVVRNDDPEGYRRK